MGYRRNRAPGFDPHLPPEGGPRGGPRRVPRRAVRPGGRPAVAAGRRGRPVHQPARGTLTGPGGGQLRAGRHPRLGRGPNGPGHRRAAGRCRAAEGPRLELHAAGGRGGAGARRMVLRLSRPNGAPGLPGRPDPAAGRSRVLQGRGRRQLRRRLPAAAHQRRLAQRTRRLARRGRRDAGADDPVPAQRGGHRRAALGRRPLAPHPHRRGPVPRGQTLRPVRGHHHRPGHRRAREAAAQDARSAPPVRAGARIRPEPDPRRRRRDPGRRPS